MRVITLTIAHDVQQATQKQLLSHVGQAYAVSEHRERRAAAQAHVDRTDGVASRPAENRALLTAQGAFTRDAMRRYAALCRGEGDEWDCVPAAGRTHGLLMQAFKALCVSVATEHTLRVSRHSTYPIYPFLLQSDNLLLRQEVASQMERDAKEQRCVLGPFWEEFLNKYPSAADILGALLSCH